MTKTIMQMDVTKHIDVESLKGLVLAKKLSEIDFHTAKLAEIGVSVPFNIPIEDLNFILSLDSSLAISLFNSLDDEDVHNHLDHWKPLEDFYKNKVIVKYVLTGNLKAAAALSLSDLGFSFKASKLIQTAHYCPHNGDAKGYESLLKDLTPPKIIFSKKQVLSMGVGEMLSLNCEGALELGASFAWSTLITGSLSPIKKMLNLKESVKVDISPKVQLSFKVLLDDAFSLNIYKETAKKYRVRINKISRKEYAGSASLSVGAEIDNKKIFDKLFDEKLKFLEDKSFKQIDSLYDKAIGKLTQKDRGILVKLAELLGEKAELKSKLGLDALREKYEAFKVKSKVQLEEILLSKVTAGFNYEYRKVKENETVFEAIISEEMIDKHHGNLIRMKLEAVLNEFAVPQPGVELIRYFSHTSTEIEKSWGLNLNIGKLSIYTGKFKESKESLTVKKENASATQFKVDVYGMKKGFREKLVNSYEWYISFDAFMDNYVSSRSQLTCEKFDYGLTLYLENDEKRVTEKELMVMLDWCVIWEIITAEQMEAMHADLYAQIKDVKHILFKFFFKLPVDYYDLLIEPLAEQNMDILAASLSASMPYLEQFHGRKFIENRIDTYMPLWKAILRLRRIDHDNRDLGKLFYKGLLPKDRDLAEWEQGINKRNMNSKHNKYSMYSLFFANDLLGKIRRFHLGHTKMLKAIQHGKHYEKEFKRAFKLIDDLSTGKVFHIRFMGRYLLDLAKEQRIDDVIEKSMIMEYQVEGEDVRIAI